jgi:hypothetical protein
MGNRYDAEGALGICESGRRASRFGKVIRTAESLPSDARNISSRLRSRDTSTLAIGSVFGSKPGERPSTSTARTDSFNSLPLPATVSSTRNRRSLAGRSALANALYPVRTWFAAVENVH